MKEFFRKVLIESGVGYRDLAWRLGVSEDTVLSWELGSTCPCGPLRKLVYDVIEEITGKKNFALETAIGLAMNSNTDFLLKRLGELDDSVVGVGGYMCDDLVSLGATRLEIIDHTLHCRVGGGRKVLSCEGSCVLIDFSIQDKGKTLKIFLRDDTGGGGCG